MTNYPLARNHKIVVQNLPDEILIYDLNINKAYCLNSTSALVYRLCDGNHSIPQISQNLSSKLKQSVSEDMIRLALDEMKKQDLLSNSDELETGFEGLSRRDVIRHVGLASIVALPLISTVVAPVAANAQSAACTNGPIQPNDQGSCPVNERCSGGTCIPCIAGGQPLPGGCSFPNLALCCSSSCTGGGTGICTP